MICNLCGCNEFIDMNSKKDVQFTKAALLDFDCGWQKKVELS